MLGDIFKPIYKGANITVCGAYCTIMEFKRACRLPFTTVAMLLNLLTLLCPESNYLPRSVYCLKKFFRKWSTPCKKYHFCNSCNVEFSVDSRRCDNESCIDTEPNTIVTFNPKRAIARVLKRKLLFSLIHHLFHRQLD